MGTMDSVSSFMNESSYKERFSKDNVNVNKDIKDNVNVEEGGIEEVMRQLEGKPEYIAEHLSAKLGDSDSKRMYLILAQDNKPGLLLESLSIALAAQRNGKVSSLARYFMGVLRRKGVKIKYKDTQ